MFIVQWSDRLFYSLRMPEFWDGERKLEEILKVWGQLNRKAARGENELYAFWDETQYYNRMYFKWEKLLKTLDFKVFDE